MIIGGLGFAVIPVNLFRRSIRDLQTARPEPEFTAQAETVVEMCAQPRVCPSPYSGSDASARSR